MTRQLKKIETKRLRESAALCWTVRLLPNIVVFFCFLKKRLAESLQSHSSFPCYSYGDHVQHFKVLQDRCSQYYVWDELFSSLNELVEFYHCNSIAKERTVFLRDPEHFARVRTQLSLRRLFLLCFLTCVNR